MKRNVFPYYKQVLTVTMVIILVALAACASTTAPASDEPNYLSLLQQNGNLTASFYALMTFKFSGEMVTLPSELTIPPIPIVWMGEIFDGKLEKSGPGQDVTDVVHSSVSTDGAWVNSLFFSRQIIRTSVNSGIFYRITLRNVPIVKEVNRVATDIGVFEKAGADLQKYVVKIEYMDGPLSSGQIVPATTYVSTDWKNTTTGQMPTLKLTFAKGTGSQETPGKGGMMGGR